MGVADDVGQPFPQHPTEELLMAGIDYVGGARELGGHPGRPQQLLARSQFPDQGHLPVVRHRRSYVGQSPAGQYLDLADLRQGPSRVGGADTPGQPGFHGDGRERVAQKVMKVACDAGALVLGRQAGQFGPGFGQGPVAPHHLEEPEHGQGDGRDGDHGAVLHGRAQAVVPRRDSDGQEQRHKRQEDDDGGGTAAQASDGDDDDEHAHHEGVGVGEGQLGQPRHHQAP